MSDDPALSEGGEEREVGAERGKRSSQRRGRSSGRRAGVGRHVERDASGRVLSEQQPSLFRSMDSMDEESPVDWHRFTVGVRRRIGLILVTACIGVAAAVGVTFVLSNQWVAEAFLLYQDEKPKTLAGDYTLNRLSLPTVLRIMDMPIHYRAVKSVLGLEMPAEDIQDMVNVETPRGRSNLIRIVTESDDPNTAVDVANTLASVVVKHGEDLNRRQLQLAYDYFNTQKELVDQKLLAHDKELTRFKSKHPHFELSTGSSNLVQRASEARSNYQSALLAYNSLLVEYENLKREAARVPDHSVRYAYEDSPLKDQMTQTEMALLQARTRYAADNPKIKQLEAQLEELRKMMTDSSLEDTSGKVYEKNPLKESLNIELMRLQGRLRSSQKTKEDLGSLADQIEEKMEDLPAEQMEFAKLLHRKQTMQHELEQLEETIRSTQLMLTLGDGDVELYQSAEEARRKSSKWDDLIAFFPVFGFLFGGIAGIFLAVGLEFIDGRLRTSQQIEEAYTVPCVQVIPEISRLHKRDSDTETLFYIRGLVERLEVAKGPAALQSVCVASAMSGEGKTTVAYHLARYCGERLGKKTILLEFDHRPNPYSTEEHTAKSIDQLLEGKANFEEVISQQGFARAYCRSNSSTKELVRSTEMDRFWERLRDTYDVIIVDSPCITEEDFVTDLARCCETTLFVVNSSNTSRRYVDSAFKELENAGVGLAGLILNNVMPAYLQDVRILSERKRMRKRRLNNWLDWRSVLTSAKTRLTGK